LSRHYNIDLCQKQIYDVNKQFIHLNPDEMNIGVDQMGRLYVETVARYRDY
jgi:hypothetical protein